MIKINNWSSLQSYKDRRPPWIRLHKTLLDDYEYQSMSANARALLPMLWLLASEDEDPVSGTIRGCYEKLIFRLRMSSEVFFSSLNEIHDAGFIDVENITEKQQCNESVSEALRIRTQTVPSETKTEAYAEPTALPETKTKAETKAETKRKSAHECAPASSQEKKYNGTRFAPPSLEAVTAYCQERKITIDPEAFVDFYASKGWKVGNTPMKNWRAAVRTWERRQEKDAPTKRRHDPL